MGDHGEQTPAEAVVYEREMHAWFRDSFLGFGTCVVLAFWWSAGQKPKR